MAPSAEEKNILNERILKNKIKKNKKEKMKIRKKEDKKGKKYRKTEKKKANSQLDWFVIFFLSHDCKEMKLPMQFRLD